MDRHVKWLRRRIIASVATQAAETFAVVAVVAFALMQWRTTEGPLSSLFGAVVIAQLFVVTRIGFAMRNNPLNYVFMRTYVERPFNYSVARFQGDEEAHPAALGLPGFAPVATIRDADADPEPCFDVYHDPSRLVAASISRASGSLALVSSLSDGRILVTDARVMPPHERLVISWAADDSFETVIASHQRAVASRTDVVELASSAHQVVLDSLSLEYESFLALGPALSPFFDLEPKSRSLMRLIARIKTAELTTLPVRLGPDKPLPDVRVTAPTPVRVEPHTPVPVMAAAVEQPAIAPAGVPAAAVVAPQVAAPQMVVADIDAATAAVLAPPAAAAETIEEIPELVEPNHALLVQSSAASAVQPVLAPNEAEACDIFAAPQPVLAEPAAMEQPLEDPAPIEIALNEIAPIEIALNEIAPVEIAPHAFVTLEAEDDSFVGLAEPITAEVPVTSFISAVVPEPITVHSLVAERLTIEEITAPDVATVMPLAPVGEHLPPPPIAPLAPVVEHSLVPAVAVAAPVEHVLPDHVLAPPATLAEAVVSAPDSPAALMEPAFFAPAPVDLDLMEPAFFAPAPVDLDPMEPAFFAPAPVAPAPVDPMEPALMGPEPATNLAAALGYPDVTDRPRPRLSAILRERPVDTRAGSTPKRSRRTSR